MNTLNTTYFVLTYNSHNHLLLLFLYYIEQVYLRNIFSRKILNYKYYVSFQVISTYREFHVGLTNKYICIYCFIYIKKLLINHLKMTHMSSLLQIKRLVLYFQCVPDMILDHFIIR